MLTAEQRFRQLLKKYEKYEPEAYNFIYEILDYTLKNVVKNRSRRNSKHVTPHELLEGCRLYAIEQFGYLAQLVFNELGIRKTRDIGEIVFNLIEHDLMGGQKSDRKKDFNDFYDFDKVFDLKPVFSYDSDRKSWMASYVQRRKRKG